MFQRLLARVGIAALAAGVALGTSGPANAQQGHQHVGGVHPAHVGGVHPAFTGTQRAFAAPAAHYGAHIYGGHTYVNHYYGARNHANYYRGGRYYGGYGYHRPYYYGGYRSWYPGVGVSLGLGYPYYGSYGYSYPYYSGYSYPYYGSYLDSATYGVPDYWATLATPNTADSAYPPDETAPVPTTDTARFTVEVPADARLWIDGQPTNQTGTVRTFQTPGPLDPGRTYSYKLTAEWVANGQTVRQDRDISFQAGNQLVVNMLVP
jgi:uncharacterized protein (TIGR03000 family)